MRFHYCKPCNKAVSDFSKHSHPELSLLEETEETELSLEEMIDIEEITMPPLHSAPLPSLPLQQNQQGTIMVHNKTPRAIPLDNDKDTHVPSNI